MNFTEHPAFVFPFVVGMLFIFIYLPVIYVTWLRKNSLADFKTILRSIFTTNTLKAVREIFSECLLHRRIFRYNIRLGYMHMSLAFGWFLLIVVGKIETMVFTHDGFNPPYLPVFFKYFYPSGIPDTFKGRFFLMIMDLLLILVLSGLFLAFLKRFRSRVLGMKRTTKHILPDRIALTFLWFIFPLRWFAESVTAGIAGSGGFFTLGSGRALASFLPLEDLLLPSWWAYSIVLGGFFFALPFSRYMHIFTEVVLIFLKYWNLATPERQNAYADFEINACSRCGICTNVCQLSADAGITHSRAVYFLRDLRYGTPERPVLENCFLCGRCSQACPVEIGIDQLRIAGRKRMMNAIAPAAEMRPVVSANGEKVDVLYFAGCMSHLTPGIIDATREILTRAGIRFSVLDDREEVCCGRPARQAGFADQARSIIARTTALINRSGASLLLVTCPICYKVFNEEYDLPIPVEHHTVFLNRLMTERPSLFRKSSLRMSYHDPCDLGRGSGIYEQPRSIIRRTGVLVSAAHEREDALCCGGSLANLAITPRQRTLVTDSAYQVLTAGNPDYVVTSCPLCKKTFAAGKREIPVADIAEIARMMLQPEEILHPEKAGEAELESEGQEICQ